MTAARARAAHLVRWAALALPVGVAAGLLSAAFIVSLEWATDSRTSHDWMIWLLPVAGLAVGGAYAWLGKGLERGSDLVVAAANGDERPVPLRIVPLIFGASVVSHLGGASVGREGAALQLAVGATDPVARRMGVTPAQRSTLVVAAIAAGFGSVFGVPVAGAVFALEVQRVGRVRYEAIVPAFVASFVADAVVRVLGVGHTRWIPLSSTEWTGGGAWRTALLGVAAGCAAWLFVAATGAVRAAMKRVVAWPALRPAVAGVVIVVLVLVFDWRDYQGLSIQLALEAQAGSTSGWWPVKLGLSALSIGAGFVGGEVIPLVVTGALLGAWLANVTGGDVALMASVGAVALLAGATNTPLACTILGLELFGGAGIAHLAVACVIAHAVSGTTGIYHTQIVEVPKSGGAS